jgi:hypothetical protein
VPKQLKSTKTYSYIQGENDSELFSKIGHWVVNPDVHKRLGIAVSALPGDIWYVHESGFLQLRKSKNGNVHIRFLFTEDEKDVSVQELLIQSALDDNADAELIFTNDRKISKIWKKFKFTEIEKERGDFCRWEKRKK